MKFTLSWLKDYLDTTADLEQITTALTDIGLEVEGVEDPSEKFSAFSVAYVEKAEPHPDADRLKVCDVKTKDGAIQVVCGAPNARAGMKAIFAPSGSYIPGLDVTLKKSKIRGVESNGMLVSEKEMELSDEHKGIIDLEDIGKGDAEIGTPMVEIFGLNDPVIEIGLTPNRADCAGIYGIARDLAAAGLGTLKPLPDTVIGGNFTSTIGVNLSDDGHGCDAFYGRLIKGVKNGPSPAWLQQRLKAIGLRPISALVDITNYFTFSYARPLHVYDADLVKGDITVRRGKKGEKFDALNDKSYEIDDSMTAICDDSGLLGLGGIVGGTSTGCEETTVNVFLECAYFNPVDIAKTGRKLGVVSDARYRFERGVDPEFLAQATELATQMIIDICGGEASDVVIAGQALKWHKVVSFDPALTRKLGGVDIEEARQKNILSALGFEVADAQATWAINVPSWRADIEGAADIVEEVLRINGLDNIENVSVGRDRAEDQHIGQSDQPVSYLRRTQAQRALASRGLLETVSWSFVSDELAELFMPSDRKIDSVALTLTNPISADLKRMRTTILSNLVPALQRNQARGLSNVAQGGTALFEVGPVFFGINPEDTMDMVAGVRHLTKAPKHWDGEGISRPVDAFDAKADILATIVACGGPDSPQIVQGGAPDWYHPGRSGTVRLGKNVLGYFGEIHPSVLEQIDVLGPIAAFEVFLDALPVAKGKSQKTAKKLLELSPFQPLTRDFAFLLEESVTAENLTRTMASADKTLIDQVSIFDIYTGKGVEQGKKSVAVRVNIQPKNATLTDKELEDLQQKIIQSVQSKLGGTLRG